MSRSRELEMLKKHGDEYQKQRDAIRGKFDKLRLAVNAEFKIAEYNDKIAQLYKAEDKELDAVYAVEVFEAKRTKTGSTEYTMNAWGEMFSTKTGRYLGRLITIPNKKATRSISRRNSK